MPKPTSSVRLRHANLPAHIVHKPNTRAQHREGTTPVKGSDTVNPSDRVFNRDRTSKRDTAADEISAIQLHRTWVGLNLVWT
jgi:hypothetical protein